MRDTHKKTGKLSAREQQLIQKMRQQPEMMERVESIFNTAYSSGKTADEIEEMLIGEIHQLGQTTMQSWAICTEQQLAEELKQKENSAVVAKKNAKLVVCVWAGGGSREDMEDPGKQLRAPAWEGHRGGAARSIQTVESGSDGLWLRALVCSGGGTGQ